jgi:NAD-dependent SIR2 family protein deacetylase
MEDFCPGSDEIAPWKCGKCGEKWDARIANRTRTDHPTGCPECNPPGRPRKPIEL